MKVLYWADIGVYIGVVLGFRLPSEQFGQRVYGLEKFNEEVVWMAQEYVNV